MSEEAAVGLSQSLHAELIAPFLTQMQLLTKELEKAQAMLKQHAPTAADGSTATTAAAGGAADQTMTPKAPEEEVKDNDMLKNAQQAVFRECAAKAKVVVAELEHKEAKAREAESKPNKKLQKSMANKGVIKTAMKNGTA